MRVLCITNYDNHCDGSGPTAIIKLNDGDNIDQVFLKWLRRNESDNPYFKGKSDEFCLKKALYAWYEHKVQEL